jgi:hypothetical protein
MVPSIVLQYEVLTNLPTELTGPKLKSCYSIGIHWCVMENHPTANLPSSNDCPNQTAVIIQMLLSHGPSYRTWHRTSALFYQFLVAHEYFNKHAVITKHGFCQNDNMLGILDFN